MKQSNSERIRVVLAEDDPAQRQIMARLLEQLGYNIVCAAANGVELLAYCKAQPADVALLDLDMPLLDGLEAAEELSQRGIPVVLISGLADSNHMVLEREPIAVRLTKPIQSEQVQNAIQVALATRYSGRLEPE